MTTQRSSLHIFICNKKQFRANSLVIASKAYLRDSPRCTLCTAQLQNNGVASCRGSAFKINGEIRCTKNGKDSRDLSHRSECSFMSGESSPYCRREHPTNPHTKHSHSAAVSMRGSVWEGRNRVLQSGVPRLEGQAMHDGRPPCRRAHVMQPVRGLG
jgi:hypothetical protein